MTLSKQQQDWHDKCYAIWKSPGTRTRKSLSKKVWAKINPDEELFNTIFNWILAFNRYQKATNTTIQYNPGFQVWLNPESPGWEDDIPSISEAKDKQSSEKCGCGRYINIQNKCWTCYNNVVVERFETIDGVQVNVGKRSRDQWAAFDRLQILDSWGLVEAVVERQKQVMDLTPNERGKWLRDAIRNCGG